MSWFVLLEFSVFVSCWRRYDLLVHIILSPFLSHFRFIHALPAKREHSHVQGDHMRPHELWQM